MVLVVLWEEFQNFPCNSERCQVSESSTKWGPSCEPIQLHPAALFSNAKSKTAIQEIEMGPDDGAGLLRSV